MRAALLIGQAPARSATLDMRAWDSASGRRLAKLMGTTHEHLLETFDTCNLNTTLHGTKGKWDLFDEDEAAHCARYLRRSILWQYPVVLLCGQRVAKAFGLPAPCHERQVIESTYGTRCPISIYAIPHPGGTNRWWNKPENTASGTTYARRCWNHAQLARRGGSGEPYGTWTVLAKG